MKQLCSELRRPEAVHCRCRQAGHCYSHVPTTGNTGNTPHYYKLIREAWSQLGKLIVGADVYECTETARCVMGSQTEIRSHSARQQPVAQAALCVSFYYYILLLFSSFHDPHVWDSFAVRYADQKQFTVDVDKRDIVYSHVPTTGT